MRGAWARADTCTRGLNARLEFLDLERAVDAVCGHEFPLQKAPVPSFPLRVTNPMVHNKDDTGIVYAPPPCQQEKAEKTELLYAQADW